MMKTILKLEELGMFLLSVYGIYLTNADWWMYLLLFLGPDIGMLGYVINNVVGAWTYNLLHHKGIAILFLMIGILIEVAGSNPGTNWIYYTGIILFGHSSMDRFFGYGLKYENGFKFTHLGEIGKK